MKHSRRFCCALQAAWVSTLAGLLTLGCSREPETQETRAPEPADMHQAESDSESAEAPAEQEGMMEKTNAPVSPEQHFADLKARADNDDSEALYTLGRYAYFGNLSEQNFVVAADYFRRAGGQGHTDAMTTLGTMYGAGKGVPQNLIEAGKWFKRAAERDNPLAQTSLAQMYLRGLGGRRPDYARALAWHQRAALLGDAYGQAGLASQYLLGQGTPKNAEQAVEWYRRAAEQGLASAQVNLGNLCRTGVGLAKDDVEAYTWFSLAARQNDPAGVQGRDALASSLSDEQFAEVEKRLEAMASATPAP